MGILLKSRSSLNTLPKYIAIGYGQARYVAKLCLLVLCLGHTTLKVLGFEEQLSGSVRIWYQLCFTAAAFKRSAKEHQCSIERAEDLLGNEAIQLQHLITKEQLNTLIC